LKKQDKAVVFTNGCFDILHNGHFTCLRKARAYGDVLIVGINSDASVKRLKGHGRPVNNENQRAAALSALDYVDYVVIFGEDTPIELITALLPDVLVKGSDYGEGAIVGEDVVLNNGGAVYRVPLVTDSKGNVLSTSAIIEKKENEKKQ
jgi:D-beta-D-heptose 7-phosphate kinase/D-beta-D-heptose 1-phosphate adenosyltransferase